MPLDPSALGYISKSTEILWDERDSMLYALSIGAGTSELHLTTENTDGIHLVTAASMPVIFCQPGDDVWERIGDFDWSGLVHAYQKVVLPTTMPPAGSAAVHTRIVEISDKGSAAVVTTRTEMRDRDDTLIAVGEGTVFMRGAGGWGGARGSGVRPGPPTGPPAHESSFHTASTQALLYRLNADRNPLHSDPAFATRAGFDRPILHGLCTFGIAARAVTGASTARARLTELSAQFSNPAYPGDNLTTRMWEPTPQVMRFDTLADGGRQVLASGIARFG